MHFLDLAQSIGTIRCLGFDRRVPPAAIMNDVIRLDDRQAHPGDEGRQNEHIESLRLAEVIEDAASGFYATLPQAACPRRVPVYDADRLSEFGTEYARKDTLHVLMPGKDNRLFSALANPVQH